MYKKFLIYSVYVVLLVIFTACGNSGSNGDGQPGGVNNAHGNVRCPMCSGTGVFVFNGYSSKCTSCDGIGIVSSEEAAELLRQLQTIDQMTGGTGYNNSSIDWPYQESTITCGACAGLGSCPVCHGMGSVSYYGEAATKCNFCNGSGRCPKCVNGQITM